MSHTVASPSVAAAPLPSDLAQLEGAFIAIERDVDALLAPLDDEQFNWRPAPGRWSVGQCLDHLNAMDVLYLEAAQAALARADGAGLRRHGPIKSSWVGRQFIAALEPPVRMKGRAPRRGRPAARRHKAEVWPEFVRVHGRIRTFLHACAEVDLNRARFRNPFVPVLTVRVGTALRIVAAHDRRHVWQAHEVRAHEGFPRS